MHTTTGYTPNPETLAALQAGDIESLLAIKRSQFGGHFMEDGGDTGDGAGDGDGGDTGDQSDNNDSGDGDNTDGQEDARVKRANAQAAAARVAKNDAQKALADAQAAQQTQLDAIAKALGLKSEDDTPDSAKLAAQIESLTSESANLRAGLLVHELAGANNANPVALLDSNKFNTALQKLDASADDYREKVTEAIKAAVTENASLSAAGQGSGAGGAELTAQQREQQKAQPATLADAIAKRMAG